MKSWLIRNPDFSFSRPISKEELVSKIESGEITPQYEICESEGYWFSIQEVDEVKKHFGEIHLTGLLPQDSEVTSSTTATTPIKIQIDPLPGPGKAASGPATAKRAAPVKSETKPELRVHTAKSRSAVGFTTFLLIVFLGILVLLWMGSQ